jgi:galactose-1-phosphate uridylyltransferase
VGTLIVKPRRHVEYVWELSEEEVVELGPLLRATTARRGPLRAEVEAFAERVRRLLAH